jgi:hypothetical protein
LEAEGFMQPDGYGAYAVGRFVEAVYLGTSKNISMDIARM